MEILSVIAIILLTLALLTKECYDAIVAYKVQNKLNGQFTVRFQDTKIRYREDMINSQEWKEL